MKTPVIVSYGGGVDSTAVLVGMWRRGERPDRIYFADVGGEKPALQEKRRLVDSVLEAVAAPKPTADAIYQGSDWE